MHYLILNKWHQRRNYQRYTWTYKSRKLQDEKNKCVKSYSFKYKKVYILVLMKYQTLKKIFPIKVELRNFFPKKTKIIVLLV